MTTSIFLNPKTWDLAIDSAGNIATTSGADRIAQDVATTCRTNLGEVIYDTTLGIRYFQDILGQAPNPGLFKAAVVQAALAVPGVVSAVCYLSAVAPEIQGQVQVSDSTGAVIAVAV